MRYIRLNNTPNHQVLHQKLAALENAEAALVATSGMAAITTTLLTVLSHGDHVLLQDTLYGGTYQFILEDLGRLGVSYDFIGIEDPRAWEKKLQHNTKAIYVEAMTNPLLQVIDLEEVVRFAKSNHLVSMIDSTFATPVNFRPVEHGFDISLHSATKYLNGHTDIVGGAVIGSRSWIDKVTHKLNHFGGSMDPHACYLLHRGIKTLGIRVRQQNRNALALAQFLEQHPRVTRVNYPGLESHPAYAQSSRLFDGFGGMLSFELDMDVEGVEAFLSRLTLPIIAPSLGGVETLATRPATTSHAGMSPDDRAALGISDGLVRVSVGLEESSELIEDFEQALNG